MFTTRILLAWSGFGKGSSCCIREGGARESVRGRERRREISLISSYKNLLRTLISS